MNHPMTIALAATALFAVLVGTASAEGTFEGRKKCYNCHKGEGESWDKTLHAKAMDSLKATRGKKKDEAMVKAKLDPKKDYSKDKDCVGCHVTGWGKEGGYVVEEPEKFVTGVSCES